MVGGSSASNLVEALETQDVASDRGLDKEHYLLFFNGRRHTVGRKDILKAEENLKHSLVTSFVGGVVSKVILPVV